MDSSATSHGSRCAGTIGAVGNNRLGVAGLNWTASIMGAESFQTDPNTGADFANIADSINAIEFTIQAKLAFVGTGGANVRVLSNSWSVRSQGDFNPPETFQFLREEIERAAANDILYVTSAGNRGGTERENNDTHPSYPVGYRLPNVVAVAATDNEDLLAPFSSYGPETVHLGAPGVGILSTARSRMRNDYFATSGTSRATPQVAGAAALILSRCALNTNQLKSVLLNNVDPVPSLAGRTITGGRLNVDRALRSCSPPPMQYYPLPRPIRLLDTRLGAVACDTPGVPLVAGQARTVLARGTCEGLTIPATAQAVVGNARVVNNVPGSTDGYVVLYPSNVPRPTVSNLNYSSGQTVPNAFTIGLGSDGAFKALATSTTNFIVDITGYYAPPPTGLYYHPLPRPVRLLDTRAGASACDTPGAPLIGGQARTQAARVTCDGVTIPSSAQAIVGNATVVNNTGAAGGFVTLYPSGEARPLAANLNYVQGQTVPNAFTVRLGNSDGAFNIHAATGINFIVDIAGYYSAQQADENGAGLLYNSLLTPVRVLDTRPGELACNRLSVSLTANAIQPLAGRRFCGIPGLARAVVGNATVVNTLQGSTSGFITLHPSGTTVPIATNLNYVAGQTVSNAFTVLLGADGAFYIYPTTDTHFIADITGYFAQ